MALEYITAEEYSAYIGEDLPSGAERLEYISKLIFSESMVPNFPTPAEVAELDAECQTSIKRAFMEQIRFLDDYPEYDSELSGFSGGDTIGRYKEGSGSSYGGNPRQRLAPNARAALAYCDELELMYAGVNNREC